MKLKKTKVPMSASEQKIYNLINQFECLCSSTWCDDCSIIKHSGSEENGSKDTAKCMSRFIYENTIEIK